ncbi:MAG: hypothetical protein KAW41_00135 [Candidatus Diapherotrites archaeon]|nr:hypothetical protein [Candidatus Diapherotrites archaeon]
MDAFLKKLLIYVGVFLAGFVATIALVFMGLSIIGNLLMFGIHLWFMYVVYNDAKAIGVNENWWLVILVLGPIGGFIYYLVTKDKRGPPAP